jgi:hypothetical protein
MRIVERTVTIVDFRRLIFLRLRQVVTEMLPRVTDRNV